MCHGRSSALPSAGMAEADTSAVRHGHWTVLRTEGYPIFGRVWCRCVCGIERSVVLHTLRRGKSRSCGCRGVGFSDGRRLHVTHDKSSTRTYRSWLHMRARCYNPKTIRYELYGGRGIRVCERWRYDFASFLADLGERPRGMTLDRIDNDRDYEPGNVRWSSAERQQRNTTRSAFEPHEIDQVKWLRNDCGYTLTEIGRFFGVGRSHIHQIVSEKIWKESRT